MSAVFDENPSQLTKQVKNTSEDNDAARNDFNEDVRAESIIECVVMRKAKVKTETRIMFRVRFHERSFSTLSESILISLKSIISP